MDGFDDNRPEIAPVDVPARLPDDTPDDTEPVILSDSEESSDPVLLSDSEESSDPVLLSDSEESTADSEEAPAPQAPRYDEPVFRPWTPPAPGWNPPPPPPYPPVAPAPKPPVQRKKKRSLGWLWLVLGLLAGFVLGYLTATAVQAAKQLPALIGKTVPDKPQGDLSERLQIADGDATATAPSQVYSRNVASVVGIASESTKTNAWGQRSSVASAGTGFILSEDGYVLTNYHVVEGAGTVTVMLYDGREYPATLVGYDSDNCDVALLKIDASGLQPVTFGDSDSLLVGQQVCAIGNPLGELTYTLTVGYVSAKDRIINTDGTPINMLQTDCTINAGNSGGPLFDMNGNVIGITTAKYSGTTSTGTTVEGIGFAIPINDVLVLLDDLQTYGYAATRAYLGVNVRVNAPAGDYPAGAYISEAIPGYCAEKAGIRGDDVITALGDYRVGSYNELVAALRHYSAGDAVEVELWRDGKTLTLRVVLDSRPHSEPVETEPETESSYIDPFGWGFTFP